MNWTTEDERKFNEMQERRKTVLSHRRTKLMYAMEGVSIPDTFVVALADFLIEHADAVRDALQPYDSGVRCTPDEPPTKVDHRRAA